MNGNSILEHEFVKRLAKLIEPNFENGQFRVSELHREIRIYHSIQHRAVKNVAGLSISQRICRVRLISVGEFMNQNKTITSESAYNCGYQSATYLTRCVHNYFGFPKREAKNKPTKKTTKYPNVLYLNRDILFESLNYK